MQRACWPDRRPSPGLAAHLWTARRRVDGARRRCRRSVLVVVRAPGRPTGPAGGVDLAEQLGDLGLDLVVEAPAQPVAVLGQLLDDLGRGGIGSRRPRPRAETSAPSASVGSSSSSSSRSMNSIPSRSTAPVRSSGSAAAMAVSHVGGQLLLALGLQQVGVGRRRGAARAGSPASSDGRVGAAAERRSRAPAARPRPRRGPGGRRPRRCAARRVSSASGSSASASATSRSATSGAAQGPLAVGEDGAVALVAAHPPVGADLAGGLGEVTGVVRRDADGLADGGDAGRPVAGRTGVRERGLGVLVDAGCRRRRGGPATRSALRGSRPRSAPRTAGSRSRGVHPLGDLRARRQRRTTVLAVGAADGWPGGPAGRRTAGGPASDRAAPPAAGDGRPGDGGPATADGRPWAGHPADAVAPLAAGAAGRSPCGRSPCGRRSCHCGRRSCRCGRAAPLRPVTLRDGGPATADGRRWAGHPADGGPADAHPAAARPAAADGRPRAGRHCGRVRRCGRSPCGRGRPAGGGPATARRSPAADGRPAGDGPATADGRPWAGHPAGDGPATADGHPAGDGPATAAAGGRSRGPDRCGRSPWGRRSCHCGRSPRCGRSPCGDGPASRPAEPPSAADGHPGDGGPATADGHPAGRSPRGRTRTRCGRSPCGRRSCQSPRGADERSRPVALGTTVLPAAPFVTGRRRDGRLGRRHGHPAGAGDRRSAGATPDRRGRRTHREARRSHREERRTGRCRRSCVRLRSRGCRAARRSRVAEKS